MSTEGIRPRFFGQDPAGRRLYAANEVTDTIVGFNINRNGAALRSQGVVARTGSPSPSPSRRRPPPLTPHPSQPTRLHPARLHPARPRPSPDKEVTMSPTARDHNDGRDQWYDDPAEQTGAGTPER